MKQSDFIHGDLIIEDIIRARDALESNNIPDTGRKLYMYRDGKEVIIDCDKNMEEVVRDIPFIPEVKHG